MFDKSHLTKITAGVYRVTELFPEKEPLKFLIRKKAIQILEGAAEIDFVRQDRASRKILKNIAILEVYFSLSKTQSWVRPENFSVLEIEYQAISHIAREMLDSCKNAIKEPDSGKVAPGNVGKRQRETKNDLQTLKPRQEKILQVLKRNGASQVRHISEVLPKYDKRVLRRDLSLLIERGLVSRIGSKTKTEYKLKQ